MTNDQEGDRRQKTEGKKTMLLDDGGFKPLRIKYGFPEIFVASVVTPEETRLDYYKPLLPKQGCFIP